MGIPFHNTPKRTADRSEMSIRPAYRHLGLWTLLALILVAFLATQVSAWGLRRNAVLRNSRISIPASVTWSDFAPTGWVTARPVSSQVTASAPNGLDSETAAYAISTDGGSSWSSWTTAGLSVTGTISITQVLQVTGLTVPDSAAQNLIRFRIQEYDGELLVSPDYVIRVDTVPPSSTVSMPAPSSVLNAVPAISGSAVDETSGVTQVSVSIRAEANGLYWNGAAWVTGEQWLPALGSTNWTYGGTYPTWADGATYVIRSRAIDEAGLTESPGPGNDFVFDVTPPTVTVISPNGGEVWAGGQAQTIVWTASDAIGLISAPITLSASYDDGLTWTVIAAGIANTGGYSWTPPILEADKVRIQVEAVDRAGNVGVDRSDGPFVLDSSAPGAPQNLTVTPQNWTNLNNFTVTWTNPPDFSEVVGAWYKLDTPPSAPNDGLFVMTTNVIAGITLPSDGAHPIYVWLQDAFGRADHQAAASTILYLDRVPPSPPFNLQGEPGRTWTNVNSFSLSWNNPPDTSGIIGAYYRINRPGVYPTDGTFISTTNVITGIQVPADGKHDIYIWLVDRAGNVDHNNRNVDPQVFWYDSTPPVTTASLEPPLSPSGWYSTSVTVTLTAVDGPGGSGVATIWHRLDDGAWRNQPKLQVAIEGEHTLRFYAQDVAGNREEEQRLDIAIDLTPPTVSVTADRLPAASGWYTAPVTLNFVANDVPTGQAEVHFRLNGGSWQQGTHLLISADGLHEIEYYAQDPAGNRSPVGRVDIQIDSVPPTTAYRLEGTQGQNGWYVTPLTVHLIPADATSGVASTFYRINEGPWQSGTQFEVRSDGQYSLSFYSVDVAGNVETSYPVTVRIDTVAPGTPSLVEVSPGIWSRVNRFSVQWANPTDLSGIAGVYYKLNEEPNAPTDGTFLQVTNRLDGLTAPGEGIHRLYLWLRDNAGNADHRSRALAPLLRYDATAPVTRATLQGLMGTNGWYRGPVTVTLAATDAHSGVLYLRYRVNNGDWVTTAGALVTITITDADKHVVTFASEDWAGNVEALQQITVRLDDTPPGPPQDLRAEPTGWQRHNSFRLLWRAPLDQSGVAGAYVRFDTPPTGPDDGTFYPAIETLEGLQVPGEGRHTIYVWLQDGAGNADHTTAVALEDALWYDGTPPVTTVTRTGALGNAGWYVGPVTFALSATDTASGLAEIRYQIDDGPWMTGNSFTIDTDGVRAVRISSRDNAGNEEPIQVYQISVDQVMPVSRLAPVRRYQPRPSFTVTWSGYDPEPGSGLAGFDVQVRDGYNGQWYTWQSGTRATEAVFEGQRGHTYFFRISARDMAGNRQPFTETPVFANIETVLNGSFDTGTFANWSTGGLLYKAVVPMIGPYGTNTLGARLGSEDYGPSLTDPGQVPVSSATISQTLRVPDLDQAPRPTLSFWYRVFTYDVMYSEWLKRYVDTFDVTLHDASGTEVALLLRDGNPTQTYGVLYDSGWKHALIDLTPYAGQTVQLVFSNHNRHDNLFNTWSYLDDVQVRDWPFSYRTYLSPIMGTGASTRTGPASHISAAAAVTEVPPGAETDRKR